MARRQSNNYFDMMKEMVECSLRCAETLQAVLNNFSVDTLDEKLRELHKIEHQGDMLNHALTEKLSKEFITPIEREDIMAMARQIDNVTDAVEDVLLKISMRNIQTIPPSALEFCDLITRCVRALLALFTELEGFKKSKTLHAALVEINHLEEDGDALYFKSVRQMFVEKGDPLTVIAWTEIYDCLEKCCDSCEDTADLVENVIMKNT